MRPKNPRVFWAWLPAAVFYAVITWIRFGPIVAVAAWVAGIAFALYLKRRDTRRRARGGDGDR